MADTSDLVRAMAARFGADQDTRRNPLMELGSRATAMPAMPPMPDTRPSISSPNWRPKSGTSQAEQMLSDAIFGAIMTPYAATHAIAEGGANAAHGKAGAAALNGAELAALLVPGRRAGAVRPTRTLEEYVDALKSRPSILNYDTYLSDPQRTINGRDRRFESMEPAFKSGEPSQEAKNLSHWRTMDSLRDKRDQGLLIGPEGHPVNPWYWPAPVWDAFEKRLGPEEAHDRLSKYLNYNAVTSMMTNVPRNVIEGWHALYNDLNGIPMARLNASELTGGAYPNKVRFAGEVASGEGIMGKTSHKIRNYSMNLHGVGTAEPEYRFQPGGEVERILSPATLDSIMGEAMNLKNTKGEPTERFRGPIYREGVGVMNKLGEEVGAAAADTQAAIWQQHQLAKHQDPIYTDSYARIFDDVMHRVAAHQGEHPEKVLDDLVHGTARPPNSFAKYGAAGLAPLIPPAGIALAFSRGDAQAEQ